MKANIYPLLAGLLLFTAFFIAARTTLAAPLPTLFVIGDSTVKNHTKGLEGWGDPIIASFDKTKIVVENDAQAGAAAGRF